MLLSILIITCAILSSISPSDALIPRHFSHLLSSSTSEHVLMQLKALPKVFIIGLPETGSAFLGGALESLSFKHTGSQHDYEDLSLLTSRSRDFDAFSGLPWSLLYREMASLYPDAKFVLTLRNSESAWLDSVKRCMPSMHSDYEAFSEDSASLDAYRNHTESVRNFFASPDYEGRLLEIVIDEVDSQDGEKWRRLCDFLGLEQSTIAKLQVKDFLEVKIEQCSYIEISAEKQPSQKRKVMKKMKKGLVNVLRGLGWLTANGL